jgi:hypothetical protein
MSKPIPFNQALRIAAKEAIASDPDIMARLGLKRLVLQEIGQHIFEADPDMFDRLLEYAGIEVTDQGYTRIEG